MTEKSIKSSISTKVIIFLYLFCEKGEKPLEKLKMIWYNVYNE